MRVGNYELVELGEVVEILDRLRKPITKHNRKPGNYPYYGATGVLDYVDNFIFDEPLVLVEEDGTKWEAGKRSAFSISGKTWVNNHVHVLRPKRDIILDVYLIELLNEMDLMAYVTGVAVLKLNQAKLKSIKIPLPPLKIQQEIAGYQKIIDGARSVVDNYKPQIDPDWEMVKLGEVCDVRDGTHDSPKYQDSGYPLITSKNLKDGEVDFSNVNYIKEEDYRNIGKRSSVENGDVLFAIIGTIGNPVVVNTDIEFSIKNVALFKFNGNTKLVNIYLKTLLSTKYTDEHLIIKSRGGIQKFVSLTDLRNFIIPLPTIETQKEIVAQIEKEQSLVNANKELITLFEQKIKDKIASVWGE